MGFAAAFADLAALKAFAFAPNVMLHALLAFFASWWVCAGLKAMPVRYVVLISKFADLLIPICAFIQSRQILEGSSLSILSLLAYIPMIYSGASSGGIKYKLAGMIALTIVAQSLVNRLLPPIGVDTAGDFSAYIACILFWRVIFGIILLIPQIRAKQSGEVPHRTLVARALLAYLSQASFFLAILNAKSVYAWPIINATPLLTTVCSHLFLGEKANKAETVSIIALGIVTSAYLIKAAV
jgi:uncharacterized membrane protein